MQMSFSSWPTEMPDRPFISRELDRRIASAQAAIDTGRIEAETAEENLKPWAAAEAWLAGHPFPGTSPRDGETRAADIYPIERTVDALTRARDRLASEIQSKGRDDLQAHWRDMAGAVRLLERQRDGMAAWSATAMDHAGDLDDMIRKPVVTPAAPSLLADMFDANGNPLPVQSQQAA